MARGYPDFEGPKVNVYLTPEWAAREGTDKTFYDEELAKTWGQTVEVLYTVPAGKTLYLTTISWFIKASVAANYDHFLYAHGYIILQETLEPAFQEAGLGGGSMAFPKPIVVSATKFVRMGVTNYSNIAGALGVTALGYEI